jgi:hypothetical protein
MLTTQSRPLALDVADQSLHLGRVYRRRRQVIDHRSDAHLASHISLGPMQVAEPDGVSLAEHQTECKTRTRPTLARGLR